MELNTVQIMDILPHRPPFLLVDRITDYEPGVWARGYKCVALDEPFFAGHFPGRPILPGVLILEALAQTGAAEMLADVFSKMLDGITNGYIVGFTFYVVGFLMTSLLYNRAVSTVLIPLVVITCSSIGCDPRGPIILVALSTMSSLVTPMATAVVPMAINAGGYSAKTCLKVGLIPGVVRGIVGTLIAMTLYPM